MYSYNNQELNIENLKNSYNDGIQIILSTSKKIEKRLKDLEEKEKKWYELQKKLEENSKKAKQKIKLDIGGKIFTTSKDTLLRLKDSYFYAMLCSGVWKPEEDNTYFIDRNPKYFDRILDYLRDDILNLDNLNDNQIEKLKKDLDYYQIQVPPEVFQKVFFLGTTLLTNEHQKILNEWLGNQKQKWKLLYKATRDGFSAYNFHSKCDYQGPTYTIIQSTDNYIFGGYCSTSWSSSNRYLPDSNIFLFTLTNPNKIESHHFMNFTKFSIYDHSNYGPTFCEGQSFDIYVCSDSNQSNQSYTNFPHYYQEKSQNAYNFEFSSGTSTTYFKTKEIEVFGKN